MVTELKIEQPTPAADLISDLPSHLVDVIDEAEDDVVELHFPLSLPTLSTMERLAFGLKGPETLLVQLQIDPKDNLEGVCVHMVSTVKSAFLFHGFHWHAASRNEALV